MELKVISQGGQANLTLSKKDISTNESFNKDVNNHNKFQDADDSYVNQEISKAMKKINVFLEDESKHAEYAVHDELQRIMIKIVDDETDKVLMEVPPEKLLDAVAMMFKAAGVLMDKKA